MIEAGLISGTEKVNRYSRFVIVHRLTLAGHEFLANAKNGTLWTKAKKLAGHLALSAFSAVLKESAVKLCISQL
ncbi:MAG: DUF2513 domain-containing protein [Planctomycetaceae bacterium]|jgi:hypothetical protein|nr:DUF2513 domain-containing protein [Planctomycetaceae bacterium]